MKAKHLYDFSIPMAVSALLVFPFVTYVCLARFILEGLWVFLILAVGLVTFFIYIIYRFVLRAAVLDEDGAHNSRVSIPRGQLTVVSEYDERFKEPIYLLRDVTKDYRFLDDKTRADKEIRVQATHGNTAKLTDYLEIPLEPAPRPRRIKK